MAQGIIGSATGVLPLNTVNPIAVTLSVPAGANGIVFTTLFNGYSGTSGLGWFLDNFPANYAGYQEWSISSSMPKIILPAGHSLIFGYAGNTQNNGFTYALLWSGVTF